MMARDLRFLPLGRAGGALAGARLMVAAQAMMPEEARAAIEPNTLVYSLEGTARAIVKAPGQDADQVDQHPE
jgi:hypothetical protein